MGYSFQVGRLERWGVGAAVALYLLLAGVLALPHEGLQYDEALMVLGGVQMLRSKAELPLPHDPDTWVCIAKRCWPLMTTRYVGSIKDWLSLPLFALFGTAPWVVRALSMAMSSFAVWGVGALTTKLAGRLAGATAALLLAVNMSFVDQTVFDNGAIAASLLAGGLGCVAIARYWDSPTVRRALLIGICAGLGVWARANFAWVVAAGVVGCAPWLWAWVRKQPVHAVATVAGSIVGALPLLVYQVISRGGTFEAVGMFQTPESPLHSFPARLVNWAESLLSDREHRAIWDGPPMPEWQMWVFGAVVVISIVTCVVCGKGMFRGLGAMLAIFYGLAFTSRLPVAEHHFVPVLPLVVIVVVVAAVTLLRNWPAARLAWIAVGVLYIGCSIWWQGQSIRGLAVTGGTGQWSDGIAVVQDLLEQKYAGEPIVIVDWGLQNNLWVMSGGRIKSREAFGDQRPWKAEAADGGLFLANGPGNRFFTAAYDGLQSALRESGQHTKRTLVRERSGKPFAELVEAIR